MYVVDGTALHRREFYFYVVAVLFWFSGNVTHVLQTVYQIKKKDSEYNNV